jgi:hypothetical protein
MEIIRTPYAVVHREESGFKDVYGGAGGTVFVECMRIVPKDSPSKRAIVFTHPIGAALFCRWSRRWRWRGIMCSM